MSVRQVVLDTETTGLDTAEGHRIIEIGCVELINRRLTRNNFHQYFNPDRDIDEGAQAVHGISSDFLRDKPRFADVVRDFLSFIRDAELIIHNAEFDVGFIDFELRRIGSELGAVGEFCTVLDTLQLARQMHPGQRNDLDSLCKRYEIDNSQRDLHGALLDAEILADVFLAMTGGQTALLLNLADVFLAMTGGQTALLLDERVTDNRRPATNASVGNRPGLRVIHADEEERAAHEAWLDLLDRESGASCVWRTGDDSVPSR